MNVYNQIFFPLNLTAKTADTIYLKQLSDPVTKTDFSLLSNDDDVCLFNKCQ